MNNLYGALALTVPLLLVIGYIMFFKRGTVYEPMMTQSMIHSQYSRQRKYIEKINRKSQSKIRKEKGPVGSLLRKFEKEVLKNKGRLSKKAKDKLIDSEKSRKKSRRRFSR